MKNKIFHFLRDYSTETFDIDRLIISSFLEKNDIIQVTNNFLSGYQITPADKEEYQVLKEFIRLADTEIPNFDFEALIRLFEFVISPADRVVNGAIYTPNNIREFITTACLEHKSGKEDIIIGDIACGCGGFLLTAAQALKRTSTLTYAHIFKHHIFGLDIQAYSTNRTKLILTILAIMEQEDVTEFEFNIFTNNALTFDWQSHVEQFKGFDIILGNPPYVSSRNLDESTRASLKHIPVCASGNPDLYIPFFQIGIELLAKDGILGFITMNTFFKSLNGRALRAYFQEKKPGFRIIDFGAQQIFHSKNTYTCICLLINSLAVSVQYYKSPNISPVLDRVAFNDLPYDDLDAKNGWNLENNQLITKIESTGTPFGKLFKTRHGIATLRNDIYIFKPADEDQNYYYLSNDGAIYPIEKGICRDIINSNKLSRPTDLAQLMEKVIFPYNKQEKPILLDEDTLKGLYPMAYQYLCEKKYALSLRDKGKGKYEQWYAFGRTQSLEKIAHKLFFPKYSDITPSFIVDTNPELLFYNGLAVIANSLAELLLAKKIMESSIFWYYIASTSKPYASNYFSLNGNYINNFGVCYLSAEEKAFILEEDDKVVLDIFFQSKYEFDLPG